MPETTRISPRNDGIRDGLMKYSIALAMQVTLFSLILPTAWAAQSEGVSIDRLLPFDPAEIDNALTAPPNVPNELQDLANTFLEHTLPRLLTNDDRLARQLGFGEGRSNPVIIEGAFAVMVIRRDKIISLLEGRQEPKETLLFNLVNDRNNWALDKDGRLIPRRISFLLKVHDSTYEAGDTSSSVTTELSEDGSSWRIIQVGAPKLSRAVSQFKDPGMNYFLLWIPDLNRHYLGKVRDHIVTLTILFRDRLLNGEPGKDQPITPEYLAKLERLYKELDLPKKLRSPDTRSVPQVQAR
jgi:hypothetical protein